MQFNLKSYQNLKTKHYLKKNSLLLFALGVNQNSKNWLILEQNLQKLKLLYYKTYNNTAIQIFKNSVYKNLRNAIQSTFFFLKTKQDKKPNSILRIYTVNSLSTTIFTILVLKLNKKLYAIGQLKTINSLTYKKNLSVMYQFLITALKSPNTVKKRYE